MLPHAYSCKSDPALEWVGGVTTVGEVVGAIGMGAVWHHSIEWARVGKCPRKAMSMAGQVMEGRRSPCQRRRRTMCRRCVDLDACLL